MEDENGLELSLGLSCGASSAKSKGTQKQDSGPGSQRSDSGKPAEKFFNDLSKANVDADVSANLNGKGVWGTHSNRSSDIDDEKWSESGSKRKISFDEINNQKKHEREAHHADLREKSKTSHISITTDDGSTAENEDVADSEVVGSTSKRVSHHDDGSKRFIAISGSSEIAKEVHVYSDSNVADAHGQKRFNMSSENNFRLGSVTYGNPFPVQSVNVLNPAYQISVKDANSAGTPSSSGHPLAGMMQIMPTTTMEQLGAQSSNPGNLPVMFGYSSIQLPTLDKDHPWGMVSPPTQFHPSYPGRGSLNSEKHNDGLKISQGPMQAIAHSSSEATQYEGRALERPRGEGKQHTTEEGSSSRAEADVRGSSMNLRPNNSADRTSIEGLSIDFSAIKPGIAADLKFGGSGSYPPNLPWVSTTGSGPHGRIISGVTYRYSTNQIRIVCACHGSHMSPEEFVRHASEEFVNPDNNSGLATFPSD
ncbi:hypothetical protein SLE2022_267480 [Rubroshorea leprosula]